MASGKYPTVYEVFRHVYQPPQLKSLEKQMSIKNRYIYVESSFESELVQTLLFEAGAGWMHSGKSSVCYRQPYCN